MMRDWWTNKEYWWQTTTEKPALEIIRKYNMVCMKEARLEIYTPFPCERGKILAYLFCSSCSFVETNQKFIYRVDIWYHCWIRAIIGLNKKSTEKFGFYNIVLLFTDKNNYVTCYQCFLSRKHNVIIITFSFKHNNKENAMTTLFCIVCIWNRQRQIPVTLFLLTTYSK